MSITSIPSPRIMPSNRATVALPIGDLGRVSIRHDGSVWDYYGEAADYGMVEMIWGIPAVIDGEARVGRMPSGYDYPAALYVERPACEACDGSGVDAGEKCILC